MEDEKCEWRFFFPLDGPEKPSTETLGALFEGLETELDTEQRQDAYVVVTDSLGVKKRGEKARLELKVRTTLHTPETSDGVKGVEVWKKYKITKKTVPAHSTPMEEALRLISEHGLLTDDVTARLTSGNKAEVLVAKQRVNAMYKTDEDQEGVQLEDCHIEADGKKYGSMAVEGSKKKIVAFLKTTPLGQRIHAMSSEEGVVPTGYPGFVVHVNSLRS